MRTGATGSLSASAHRTQATLPDKQPVAPRRPEGERTSVMLYVVSAERGRYFSAVITFSIGTQVQSVHWHYVECAG